MNQLLQQLVDSLRKLTRHRTHCRTCRSFGAGINQVGNGFSLRQVDLVIQKSPFSELSGLRHPYLRQTGLTVRRIDLASRFQATRQQQLKHDRAAMRLQLQHILAGIGMRRGEKNRQPLINHLTLRILKRQISRLTR